MEKKIENVPIQKIYRSTEDRSGERYISSKGNPFTKVDIYIDPRTIDDPDFEGKMTYFDYYNNADNWDVGTSLTGMIAKNGKYFNFKMLKPSNHSIPLDVKKLEQRVSKLESVVFKTEKTGVDEAMKWTQEAMKEDKDEVDIEEDLPF